MYTLASLQSLPTIVTGQSDDLKIEGKFVFHGRSVYKRVWLSRCGVEDGEPYPNKVTIEVLSDTGWQTIATFRARGMAQHEIQAQMELLVGQLRQVADIAHSVWENARDNDEVRSEATFVGECLANALLRLDRHISD